MRGQHRGLQHGFTLIELIIVVVLLGVLSVGTFGYLGLAAQIYTDVVGREQLSAQSRFAIERLSRELRNSLPASARAFSPLSNSAEGGRCIEFIPIRGSGIYLQPPQPAQLLPVSRATNIASIPNEDGTSTLLAPDEYVGLYFFIAANNELRIYDPDSTSRTQIALGAVEERDSYYEIDLDEIDSSRSTPARRYYLTTTPVAWCVVGEQPPYDLVRYSHYSNFTQVSPPSLESLRFGPTVERSKMATDLFDGDGSAPFITQIASLSRNNLILVNFFFARREGQEPLVIHHEVHVPNVP